MGKNNNIIEINGQRYDARTGTAVGQQAGPAKRTRRSVDGVLTATNKPTKSVKKATTKPTKPAVTGSKQTINDIKRRPAKGAASHSPQRSQTLMRHVVKKPPPAPARTLKAQSPSRAVATKPESPLQAKISAYRLDTKRLQHAQTVAKSQLVTRFGQPSRATVPAPQPATAIRPKPAAHPTAPKKAKTTADLLQHAIDHATSHQQPPVKAKRQQGRLKRIFGISTALLIALAVVGFLAAQNLTTIRLHLASSKAGFTASLPSYQPAGYHLSQLNASSGLVAFQFHSNSDNRSYAITEKSSGWDSQALRDVFVAAADRSYQTVESAGRTLYLYGQHQATWVNSGIWYQVASNGALSDHQLVELATSL